MALVLRTGRAAPPSAPALPEPRGDLSEWLVHALRQSPASTQDAAPRVRDLAGDVLDDDDLQLALYCCYELHYRGFAGVDSGWEWAPSLLAFRQVLETGFESRLREEVGPIVSTADVGADLYQVVADGAGPSLSAYMAERGTVEQMREFCVHRSAYQLKEADPHTWAIPRIRGEAKAAMVEIQADEYGNGDPAAMHAALFADTMSELGLDPTYGAYLDLLPGFTLATVNLVSMLGLHRRHRGALVGHLALFEITSVAPMSRYSACLARLGLNERARRFYDVHVIADAIHEVIAIERMVRGFAADEPELAPDVVFGARVVCVLEARLTLGLLDAWARRQSSLRAILP